MEWVLGDQININLVFVVSYTFTFIVDINVVVLLFKYLRSNCILMYQQFLNHNAHLIFLPFYSQLILFFLPTSHFGSMSCITLHRRNKGARRGILSSRMAAVLSWKGFGVQEYWDILEEKKR